MLLLVDDICAGDDVRRAAQDRNILAPGMVNHLWARQGLLGRAPMADMPAVPAVWHYLKAGGEVSQIPTLMFPPGTCCGGDPRN